MIKTDNILAYVHTPTIFSRCGMYTISLPIQNQYDDRQKDIMNLIIDAMYSSRPGESNLMVQIFRLKEKIDISVVVIPKEDSRSYHCDPLASRSFFSDNPTQLLDDILDGLNALSLKPPIDGHNLAPADIIFLRTAKEKFDHDPNAMRALVDFLINWSGIMALEYADVLTLASDYTILHNAGRMVLHVYGSVVQGHRVGVSWPLSLDHIKSILGCDSQ